mgnify:CR=1 FL=1
MRLLLALLGAVMIVIGFPLFWTPIPIGLVLIVVGLTLLVGNSVMAQNAMRGFRARNRALDRRLQETGARAPAWVRAVLDKTQPQDTGNP